MSKQTQDSQMDKLARGENQTVPRITEATTLTGGQTRVDVTIPLATADDYAITLPPVAECAGREFVFRGIRASGSYVDGAVTIQDQDDSILASDIASDPMTATNDYVVVANRGGLFWVITEEVTT